MGKSVNAVMMLIAAGWLATPAWAQDSVEVSGLDGRVATITLTALPRQTVSADDHGSKATFEGTLLRDVLAKAGVAFGDSLRGTAMSKFVVVSARDDYRVVFALPELDAGFTDAPVLLADRRDGKPLTREEGPLRIVVPHEKRAGRWVRQVLRLEIRDAR